MLEINQLNKTFGSLKALDNLSFHVNPGEIFGFVGSNGAGKTTAMRIMMGVMAADSGTVAWNGADLDFAARRRIGYMPSERGLYPRMQVGPQLEYLARLHGLNKAQAHSNTEEWTERLGIAWRRDDNVQKLSLGNQQRVQLAAALVHDPALLILDEPFSGLDPTAVEVMSKVLQEKAATGAPVIFSSHQLDLVERLSDRVGIISLGAMVAEGTVDELRATGTEQLAVAAGVSRQAVVGALARFAIEPADDPLAGTSEAPDRDGTNRFVFTPRADVNDQEVLRALMEIGPVHEFAPRRPHLSELFNNVVVTPDEQPEEKPAKRGWFSRKKGA
ncbi:ABC transporter ATP-binding protein [Ancrocorticia populi]|uniref:ABC transporter ATP-binding protein n=1 Tax=Ancrocorticia populi TaxID=2175228 RepID=UPI003F96A51A